MKFKKLVLNKEVLARVSENQMNRLWGGNYYQPTMTCGGDDGTTMTGCTCNNTCDGYVCDTSTQEGSGCHGETCGSAYTCNGR